MSEQNANPVELFGMRVAHVGINATDPADALEIAELFSTMMGLPVIETPVSYFNDSLVEIMKQNGRGTKGHIGFAVNDIDAAEKWFAERCPTICCCSEGTDSSGKSTMPICFSESLRTSGWLMKKLKVFGARAISGA